ncbi:hypothetical protein SNEBB_000666 [Seison nebaliae]|nr:hypothetical protein SNEBB_000666 [Seison nebaliae]
MDRQKQQQQHIRPTSSVISNSRSYNDTTTTSTTNNKNNNMLSKSKYPFPPPLTSDHPSSRNYEKSKSSYQSQQQQQQHSRTLSENVGNVTSYLYTAGYSAQPKKSVYDEFTLVIPEKNSNRWHMFKSHKEESITNEMSKRILHEPPAEFGCFLSKMRNRPLKGWHRRYFLLSNGHLTYSKRQNDVKTKTHGHIDVVSSCITFRVKNFRIRIDEDRVVYQLRTKNREIFNNLLKSINHHRTYGQVRQSCITIPSSHSKDHSHSIDNDTSINDIRINFNDHSHHSPNHHQQQQQHTPTTLQESTLDDTLIENGDDSTIIHNVNSELSDFGEIYNGELKTLYHKILDILNTDDNSQKVDFKKSPSNGGKNGKIRRPFPHRNDGEEVRLDMLLPSLNHISTSNTSVHSITTTTTAVASTTPSMENYEGKVDNTISPSIPSSSGSRYFLWSKRKYKDRNNDNNFEPVVTSTTNSDCRQQYPETLSPSSNNNIVIDQNILIEVLNVIRNVDHLWRRFSTDYARSLVLSDDVPNDKQINHDDSFIGRRRQLNQSLKVSLRRNQNPHNLNYYHNHQNNFSFDKQSTSSLYFDALDDLKTSNYEDLSTYGTNIGCISDVSDSESDSSDEINGESSDSESDIDLKRSDNLSSKTLNSRNSDKTIELSSKDRIGSSQTIIPSSSSSSSTTNTGNVVTKRISNRRKTQDSIYSTNVVAPKLSELTGRRSALPAPAPNPNNISLWNILKRAVGKDLSKISLPVILNEPLSILERLCEDIEYSELIDIAYSSKDPIHRLMYVAAFAVSSYASSYYRSGYKNFNPVLGETYENVRDDRGWKFVAEQVSHHPPISASYCEGKNFTFVQEFKAKVKFWGKSIEMIPSCYFRLDFPKLNEVYEWNKVSMCIHNVMAPTSRWIDHYGDLLVTKKGSNAKCTITFPKAQSQSYLSGWFGTENAENTEDNRCSVFGNVYDEHKKLVYKLFGSWHEQLHWSKVGDDQSASTNCHLLWRMGTMPADAQIYYGFSRFAIELNELPVNEEEKKKLPSTDSRFRQDLRLLEFGDVERAGEAKNLIEIAQRERREEKRSTEPMWFNQSNGRWKYTGDYWSEREKGFRNKSIPELFPNVDDENGELY